MIILNENNYKQILKEFIEVCKNEYKFTQGYIDDVDDNNIYIVFSDSSLYPYTNGDYISTTLYTGKFTIHFTFKVDNFVSWFEFGSFYRKWAFNYFLASKNVKR